MTKQITLQMSETDAVDTFTVSEQYVEQWIKDTDNVWNYEVTEQDVAEFEALVDSVYATLTHKQKQQLLAEAIETYNNVIDFFATQDTDQDLYKVSARQHLASCITMSLTDYYVAIPA